VDRFSAAHLRTPEFPPQSTSRPHIPDIDGDGVVDVASTWGASEEDLTTGVQIAFGAPPLAGQTLPTYDELGEILRRPYTQSLPEEQPRISAPPSIQSADLDGDGRPELIVDGRHQGEVFLLWNEGDRQFRAEPLDATSARIIGPGDLALIEDGVLWRVPVYGRRLGARAKVGETTGSLREVTECTGDGIPDLLLTGSPRMMVGVSHSFVGVSDGFWGACVRIDGDEIPDIVSFGNALDLHISLTDPPS